MRSEAPRELGSAGSVGVLLECQDAARRRLARGDRGFVAAVPGVVLDVAECQDTTISLSAGAHEAVEFRFVRRRGGGAVVLTSGARLVLVSLGVALRLNLQLSDRNGDALDLNDLRALLGRIPFSESAVAIEVLAEEVGLLPRRVRLAGLSSSAACRHYRGVFFG